MKRTIRFALVRDDLYAHLADALKSIGCSSLYESMSTSPAVSRGVTEIDGDRYIALDALRFLTTRLDASDEFTRRLNGLLRAIAASAS